VAPLLLPFGAALPLLHRELARRDERSLGRLLGWEALGALLGMPLTYGLLALGLGLGGVIGVWSALATAAAAASALSLGRAMLGPVALGAVASALVLGPWLPPPARSSPPLSNPALRILAFAEDEHFAVSVVDDGISGERTLLTDGFRAAGTGPDYAYMRALGHLPLLLHPAPRRVCVLAFGTGTTAGAVALHPEVEAILILELSRAVIGVAPWFAAVHGGVLASERVRLVTGDGRRALAEREGAFDLLTMEPLLPNSPFGVYLYTREFYERARRALAPGGLLCQWVPPHALDPESFAAVIDGFARAFAWSGLFLSGTQLLLLGGEREPELSAERFPSAESALARALAEIGLERPAGVLARYLGPGESFGPAPRPLSDADPWIVHRPPPRGARSLSWLPRNLAAMREREEDPPRSWRSGLDAAGRDRVEGMAAARRVREALAVRAAEMAGLLLEDPRLLRELDLHLSDALQRAWEDAGVRALALEAEFTIARQRGLLALSALPGAEGGRASVGDLLRAAELRPGRGDVHLHLAVALERIGELEGARHALERALELCPGLARTPAWEQARRLGFPATRELAWVSGG
jgi:spermidine synthase